MIELMIVVAILGILAALAIPAFINYVRRSKTAEVSVNLGVMFKLAASYMAQEYSSQGVGMLTGTYCSVSSDALSPNNPSAQKQRYVAGPNARALGISIADDVYFGYGLQGSGACGWAPNTTVYTFFAQGDLDSDGVRSTFELAAGTDEERTLRHAIGIHAVNDVE